MEATNQVLATVLFLGSLLFSCYSEDFNTIDKFFALKPAAVEKPPKSWILLYAGVREQLLVRWAQNIRGIICSGGRTDPLQTFLFFSPSCIFVKISITLTELADDNF